MRRKEFAAKVWSKLIAFERSEGLFRAGEHVLAAVSGGPDSVCLAHFLTELSRRRRFALRLAHIHHGLRGASADKDAAFVLKLAARLGLEATVLRADARALARRRGGGTEDAARALRYAALAREARRYGCRVVAVGQHLDDQAETVLLNLLRGTRLKGLGGMPPMRTLAPGVRLVRPLLPISRAEILEYLKQHALPFRRDPTNRSTRFLRNWLRLRALPLLQSRQPRVRERLAGLADQVRRIF